jgi:hypothetical protein
VEQGAGAMGTGTDEASTLDMVSSFLLGVRDESCRLLCWYLLALARLNHRQGEDTTGRQNTADLAKHARVVVLSFSRP